MKIVIAHGEDWCGLYVDGVLVAEDHSLEPETVLDHLGINCEEKWVDDSWLFDRGRLPSKLSEVKFQ